MRRFVYAAALAATLMLGGLTQASAAMPATVALHPPAGSHMMSIMHAFGSARISYTMHDANIKVTTDNLPAPAAAGGRYYVVWAVRNATRTWAGVLNVHGAMAGGHYMIMDTMFTQLVVSAEKTRHPMHMMGARVLVGAVVHNH